MQALRQARFRAARLRVVGEGADHYARARVLPNCYSGFKRVTVFNQKLFSTYGLQENRS